MIIGVRQHLNERHDQNVDMARNDPDGLKRAMGIDHTDEVTVDELRKHGAAPARPKAEAPALAPGATRR
jgi:hypothetical protein